MQINFPGKNVLIKLYRLAKGIPSDTMRPRRFFTAVYRKNLWFGVESRSGRGSEGIFAKQKISILEKVINTYNIKSILDLGCGDYSWMKQIACVVDRYHGIDVVKPLIRSNIARYESQNTTFQCLDLTSPDVQKMLDSMLYDLVVCLDLLGHLLNSEVDHVIDFVIHRITAKYLLITNRRDENSELYVMRPKTRHEGINIQKHKVFQEYGLAPIWGEKAEFPGDFFEFYKLPKISL